MAESEKIEFATPDGAPLNEIVARYLKAGSDPREVVRVPEAPCLDARVEERLLAPLGEARLGYIGLEKWLRRWERDHVDHSSFQD
jgi:hypothetical protein